MFDSYAYLYNVSSMKCKGRSKALLLLSRGVWKKKNKYPAE